MPLGTPISAAPRGWEVYLGIQVTRPGAYLITGFDVTYRSGGRTYRQHVPGWIALCTPGSYNRAGLCPLHPR